MIAFGIDPGSQRTGWGVVRADGSSMLCLQYGVVAPDLEAGLPARLAAIFAGVGDALDVHRPDVVFLESIFHHKNARSALVLGHARGAALLAAGIRKHVVAELTPAEVKKAVTGRGRADKIQIQEMVRILLGLDVKAAVDASDALAIAMAGAVRTKWTEAVGRARAIEERGARRRRRSGARAKGAPT